MMLKGRGASPVAQWQRIRLLVQEMQEPWVIPGLGSSPRAGNGNLLQYSCLENAMGRGAWWATVHGVTESDMTEWLTPTSQILLYNTLRSS